MKIKHILTAAWGAAVFLLLSGCGPVANSDYSVYAPSEDNRLIIYTSREKNVYAPLVKEFEERTGIWVQVETGGTGELLKRIAAQTDNPCCDLIITDNSESLEACKNLFSPYLSPLSEELPASYTQKEGLWTPFSLSPLVLVYNPQLVRTNPPDGWNSLLDSAWEGKIAFANPEVSGSGYGALEFFLQVLPQNEEELLENLAYNLEGQILDNSGQIISEVANGGCYVGVTMEESALNGIKNGYDLALVYPKEGTAFIPSGLAIVSGCAHEENAKKFIDFILTDDVQNYLSKSCSLHPVRGGLTQAEDKKEDFLLFPHDIFQAGSRQKEILALWRSIWKEVAP